MLTQTTLEHLRALKLDGMASGLEEQRLLPAFHDLGFETGSACWSIANATGATTGGSNGSCAALSSSMPRPASKTSNTAPAAACRKPSLPASPATTGSVRDRASCSPAPPAPARPGSLARSVSTPAGKASRRSTYAYRASPKCCASPTPTAASAAPWRNSHASTCSSSTTGP